MKTNNHPAQGPVSLERLHQIRETLSKAAAQSDGGNLGYAMADAVKVIDGAIAAFGAEPAPVDIEMLATVLRNAPLAPSDSQGKPRAPVVPEVMANPDESQYGGAGDEDYRAEYAYVEGWNACRAAMLQGAEPVRKPVIDEHVRREYRVDGSPWIQCSKEAYDRRKAAGYEVRELYERPQNSPQNIPGNIPDGWVAVPVEPTAEMYDAGDQQLATKQVWDAMIAAAPQQEVKP